MQGDSGRSERDVQPLNQNCCSLTIWNSTTSAFPRVGAVMVTLTVALAPGATSAGSAMRSSESHAVNDEATWLGQPPGDAVKCAPRWTGIDPPLGHGWLPVLVTGTAKVCD